MKRCALLMLIFILACPAYSQITYESPNNYSGDWYSTSSWVRLPVTETWAPDTPGNPTNSVSNAITVNGYIRIEGGGLTINNANPVVTVNDTLYIVGDVLLGSGASLNVAANGILIVTGNLTLEGSFNLANGGNIVVEGNLNVTNGTVQNNSNFYVFGSSPVSGGGTINGCDGFGNPGGCSPATAGNIGDATDLANDNPDLLDFVNDGGVLPVTLGDFEVYKVTSKTITLAWTTLTELNFDYFSLERSTGGIFFEEIARVPGHGISFDPLNYFFEDTNPFVGKNYYRLTSVDFDGYKETFDMRAADFMGEKSIIIHPNPVTDSKLSIDFNFLPEGDALILVTDLTGTEVARAKTSEVRNEFDLSIPRGTYLVAVLAGETRRVSRLVVR